MKKSVFVIAVIAAACSSGVFAGEVDKKAPAPIAKAKTMTDADMDKTTGAGFDIQNSGVGLNEHANVNFHAFLKGFNGQNGHAARAIHPPP